jgi:hypothetical protein
MTNDQVGGPLEGVPQGSPDGLVAVVGDLDDLVAQMIAEGWRYRGGKYVEGLRVRYLIQVNGQVGGPFEGSPQGPGEQS